MPGVAQPLQATSLHAVLANKAHSVAAKRLFVRKSAGTGNMATTNTAEYAASWRRRADGTVSQPPQASSSL